MPAAKIVLMITFLALLRFGIPALIALALNRMIPKEG